MAVAVPMPVAHPTQPSYRTAGRDRRGALLRARPAAFRAVPACASLAGAVETGERLRTLRKNILFPRAPSPAAKAFLAGGARTSASDPAPPVLSRGGGARKDPQTAPQIPAADQRPVCGTRRSLRLGSHGTRGPEEPEDPSPLCRARRRGRRPGSSARTVGAPGRAAGWGSAGAAAVGDSSSRQAPLLRPRRGAAVPAGIGSAVRVGEGGKPAPAPFTHVSET